MAYRAKKVYGKKTGDFKTVLGRIENGNPPKIRVVGSGELLPIHYSHEESPLQYFMLQKWNNNKGWSIIRVCSC